MSDSPFKHLVESLSQSSAEVLKHSLPSDAALDVLELYSLSLSNVIEVLPELSEQTVAYVNHVHGKIIVHVNSWHSQLSDQELLFSGKSKGIKKYIASLGIQTPLLFKTKG